MVCFVAFDVETTGTVSGRDRIIEIGLARFDKGQLQVQESLLIDPGMPIPAESSRVHGILDDMVKGQPGVIAALELLTRMTEGADLLVAHNAPFDIKFLHSAALEESMRLPTVPIIDTYPLGKRVVTDLFNHRLETLTKHFKVEAAQFHRAVADAVSCGYVFLHLLSSLKKQGVSLSLERVGEFAGGLLRFPVVEVRPKQMGLL